MNYNPKVEKVTSQEISLKNREDLEITGVQKLISLNQEEFIVDTTLGYMVVRGYNLEMKQLDIEKGFYRLLAMFILLNTKKAQRLKK